MDTMKLINIKFYENLSTDKKKYCIGLITKRKY